VAALFAAYFAGFGVFLPFFPVWLDWIGLSAAWIAVLVSAPLIVRVMTTSVVSDAAERFDDPRKPLLALALLATVAFAIVPVASLFAGFPDLIATPWVLLVVIGAYGSRLERLAAAQRCAWHSAFSPIRRGLWPRSGLGIDCVCRVELCCRRGCRSLWRPNRSLAGARDVWGAGPGLCRLPRSFVQPKVVAVPGEVTRKPKLRSGWMFFLRRKGAMSVFIGAGLMQASHAFLYGFGSLSWAAQGFSETAIGMLWSFGVFCEIVLFAVSAPIIARLGARGLLILGGIGATIRWAIFAFSPDLAFTGAATNLARLLVWHDPSGADYLCSATGTAA
jgi:PPP family 3-phenylpropionic acid transporter